MLSNAVILGGLGQMGTLISHSLRDSGVAVILVDARPQTPNAANSVEFLQSDVAALGPELRSAIGHSDCLFVCLPEKITLQIASRLAEAMPHGSLWVDTLSAKTGIVRAIEAQSGRLELLSVNPMFAPVMGWAGNSVALVEVFGGPKSAFLKKLLTTWGARLEAVSAEDHDHLTAAIQVATHAALLAFGAALLNLNFDLEKALRLSTPPHRLMLTLLYRMTTQSAEVYWDIQAYHPLGSPVRQEMMRALECIDEDAGRFESKRLAETFSRLTALFETRDELFKEWAKRVFAGINVRTGDDGVGPVTPALAGQ